MINIIEPSSQQEWEDYYLLRYKTLREPWGMPKGSEKDDNEENSIHFFALDNNIPIGVCRLQYNDESTGQIRFMGVDSNARNSGVGKILIAFAEERAKKDGRNKMILQARDYAVPFYEKSGYVIREKTFLLWDTIQHYLMEKSL